MTTQQYIEALEDVVKLGIGMRRLQRKFFTSQAGTPERRAFGADARVAERTFDQAVAKLKAPSLSL